MGDVGEGADVVDERLWGDQDKPQEGTTQKKEDNASVQVCVCCTHVCQTQYVKAKGACCEQAAGFCQQCLCKSILRLRDVNLDWGKSQSHVRKTPYHLVAVCTIV